MAKSPNNWDSFVGSLAEMGLLCAGGLRVGPDECPVSMERYAGLPAILIGNAGGAMWEVFSKSPEYLDCAPNPMNRWTERVIGEVTMRFGGEAVFPFQQPHWPFQRLATAAAGLRPSPIGVLIHPDFGLWHAFRALIIFNEGHDFVRKINELVGHSEKLIHPCDSCVEKPCLSACPANAFDGDALDVELCFGHLDTRKEPDCMSIGCRARDACPVGKSHRYRPEQIQFHMKYYRG